MATPNPIHILALDDDQDDCVIFEEALAQSDKGAALRCIHSFDELVSVLEDFYPDIVFTDLNLPKKNGVECIREIKSRFPDTVVIIYTGSTDHRQMEAAYREGAELVFQKPDLYADLVKGLRVLLSLDWTDKADIKQRFYGRVVDMSKWEEDLLVG